MNWRDDVWCTAWEAKVQLSWGTGRPAGPLQLAMMDSFIAGPKVPFAKVMNGFPTGGSADVEKKRVINPSIVRLIACRDLF